MQKFEFEIKSNTQHAKRKRQPITQVNFTMQQTSKQRNKIWCSAALPSDKLIHYACFIECRARWSSACF